MGMWAGILAVVPLLVNAAPVNETSASTRPTTENSLDLLYCGVGFFGLLVLMRTCCSYCSKATDVQEFRNDLPLYVENDINHPHPPYDDITGDVR